MDEKADFTSPVRVQCGDRALTLRETERLYGIPAHRLRQYRTESALDFFKLGRALFVSERSVVDFLERHRAKRNEVLRTRDVFQAGPQPRAAECWHRGFVQSRMGSSLLESIASPRLRSLRQGSVGGDD